MVVNEDNKVVVYSKANCPQCVTVKTQFDRKGVQYSEVRIDDPKDIDKQAAQWLIGQGHRMLPVVYVDGVHVSNPLTVTSEII